MIEESARVIACDGGYAIVETHAKAACGSCSSEQGCSTSVLAGLFKRRQNRLKVLNPIQAKPGQRVVIGLDERALVIASLLTYLLPLLFLILGAIAVQELARYWAWPLGELSSIVGGLSGLIIGLGLVSRLASGKHREVSFQAVILRQEIGQTVPFT